MAGRRTVIGQPHAERRPRSRLGPHGADHASHRLRHQGEAEPAITRRPTRGSSTIRGMKTEPACSTVNPGPVSVTVIRTRSARNLPSPAHRHRHRQSHRHRHRHRDRHHQRHRRCSARRPPRSGGHRRRRSSRKHIECLSTRLPTIRHRSWSGAASGGRYDPRRTVRSMPRSRRLCELRQQHEQRPPDCRRPQAPDRPGSARSEVRPRRRSGRGPSRPTRSVRSPCAAGRRLVQPAPATHRKTSSLDRVRR